MIFVNIKGGLGNQLFQYAFGRVVAGEKKLLLDVSTYRHDQRERQFLLNQLNIKATSISNTQLLWIVKKTLLLKREVGEFAFDASMKQSGFRYFDGYWQNYKYADTVRQALLREFKSKTPTKYNYSKNTVAIHIRRGDYANDPATRKMYHLLPKTYYKKAIDQIEKKIKNPNYLVFSDDPSWVKENFQIDRNITVIQDSDPVDDLIHMSRCSHFIIANSTFSWWGAWLSQSKDKIVYMPKNWFKNKPTPKGLVPPKWRSI